jgi:sarcosine oxidase subunit beta
MSTLPAAAEVVILGSGVIGASIAWHLAERGCRDVLVLDRAAGPALGSTARATGGFRAQFASEVNIRLSLLSREKLRRFPDEVGADPGYRPRGYLFLAADEDQLAALREIRPLQRSLGLTEVEEVSAEEVQRLSPAISVADVAGGSYGPTDGYIVPGAIARGYAEAARRLGVRFAYDTAVTGLARTGDRLTGIETSHGTLAAGQVVNAAGAWAGAVAALAGVDLPVKPLRRQVAATVPTGRLSPDLPMTIFLGDGFHFRERDGRVLLLWPREDDPADADFDDAVDPRWVAEVERRTRTRVPGLDGVAIDPGACWAGLYEMSPDRHAIVGPAPGLSNFVLANGSSGHGVMHAPALGQLVAEILLDGRATAVDLHALRPERFAEGLPNAGISLL